MKRLALFMAVLGIAGMTTSCTQFNNAWTAFAPQWAETLPPPSSVAGGTIKIETTPGNWETVKMKSNSSGTVMGYDSTEGVKYAVIDGRAYLDFDYTQLISGGRRIINYSLDGESINPLERENSSYRSAYINIQSVNGKEYYGVLNGYLHNQYYGTTEQLRSVPIVIKVK